MNARISWDIGRAKTLRDLNWSFAAIAAELGVSESTIWKKLGKSDPSVERAVCAALNRGALVEDIAADLKIGESTVRTIRFRALRDGRVSRDRFRPAEAERLAA